MESLWDESLEFVGEGGRADDPTTVACFFNSIVIGDRFLGGGGSTETGFLFSIFVLKLNGIWLTFLCCFSFHGFLNASFSWGTLSFRLGAAFAGGAFG